MGSYGTANRLFKGGDLLWDGVIIKEIPEMFIELGTTFAENGTAGAEVGCALRGAGDRHGLRQALED